MVFVLLFLTKKYAKSLLWIYSFISNLPSSQLQKYVNFMILWGINEIIATFLLLFLTVPGFKFSNWFYYTFTLHHFNSSLYFSYDSYPCNSLVMSLIFLSCLFCFALTRYMLFLVKLIPDIYIFSLTFLFLVSLFTVHFVLNHVMLLVVAFILNMMVPLTLLSIAICFLSFRCQSYYLTFCVCFYSWSSYCCHFFSVTII